MTPGVVSGMQGVAAYLGAHPSMFSQVGLTAFALLCLGLSITGIVLSRLRRGVK